MNNYGTTTSNINERWRTLILRSLSCKLRSTGQTYGGLQLGYANKSLVTIFPDISGSVAVLKFLFLKAANKNVQPPFLGLRLGHAVMDH